MNMNLSDRQHPGWVPYPRYVTVGMLPNFRVPQLLICHSSMVKGLPLRVKGSKVGGGDPSIVPGT